MSNTPKRLINLKCNCKKNNKNYHPNPILFTKATKIKVNKNINPHKNSSLKITSVHKITCNKIHLNRKLFSMSTKTNSIKSNNKQNSLWNSRTTTKQHINNISNSNNSISSRFKRKSRERNPPQYKILWTGIEYPQINMHMIM